MLYVDGELVINRLGFKRLLHARIALCISPLKAGLTCWSFGIIQWHGADEASFDMHVEEYEIARSMQMASGGVISIGVIVTIVGFLLKPKVKI
jgi:hypothetical protein